jgi:hypothetical protein
MQGQPSTDLAVGLVVKSICEAKDMTACGLCQRSDRLTFECPERYHLPICSWCKTEYMRRRLRPVNLKP